MYFFEQLRAIGQFPFGEVLAPSWCMLAALDPINGITSRIIKCAIEVHRIIGPGLLEAV